MLQVSIETVCQKLNASNLHIEFKQLFALLYLKDL